MFSGFTEKLKEKVGGLLRGGQRVCWPPYQIIGGGPVPPAPPTRPPSSYAYVAMFWPLHNKRILLSACQSLCVSRSARLRSKIMLVACAMPFVCVRVSKIFLLRLTRVVSNHNPS